MNIANEDGLANLCAALVESAKREASGRGVASQAERQYARMWLTEPGGMFEEICAAYGYDRAQALRALAVQMRGAGR